MMRVKCNRCGWTGFEDDLHTEPDYDDEGVFWGYTEYCPRCESSDALMDLGDPDEDVDAIVAGIYGERAEDLDELGKEIAD